MIYITREDSGLIAETEEHKYLGNDDYVVILAKNSPEEHVIKTFMSTKMFRKNLQDKIR